MSEKTPKFALSSEALRTETRAIEAAWVALKPLSTPARMRVCEWLREWTYSEMPARDPSEF